MLGSLTRQFPLSGKVNYSSKTPSGSITLRLTILISAKLALCDTLLLVYDFHLVGEYNKQYYYLRSG